MAASTKTSETPEKKPSSKTELALIWLDDSAETDPNLKAVFLSLFDQVFTFNDTGACLELVESAEPEAVCLSILVSGKYGQMLVRDRFQPLNQVKYIYVYCFDIAKHSQWAQECDKVRCVESDLNKILKCMQNDVQNSGKKQQKPPQPNGVPEQQQQQEEPIRNVRERFTDDNNLFNKLALDLLLRGPDDDGAEDFTNYCNAQNEDEVNEEHYFNPKQPIGEWYKPDLVFLNLNSNNFNQLWALRWFIRLFHRQLTTEHERFIKDRPNFTVNYGTCLDTQEFSEMKHRVGQMVVLNELLLAYADRHKALRSVETKKDDQSKQNVIFEINVDPNIRFTVPYGEIQKDQVLFWFGSRYRLVKIEYIEQKDEHQDAYWLIGLNLYSTLDTKPSITILYDYYLKTLIELNDVQYALGKILMYKGSYYQAEKWLQTTNQHEDLAELALRQSEYERANQYLEQSSEDSYDANLLRAYGNILSSNDNIVKGRTILMKICSEATDRLVRARANIVLGFLSLIVTQQIDQALEYFTAGNETLCKLLPDIHPDIAKSFIGIGYTHFARRNIDDARKYFEMALTIQKQSLPSNHPDFAKTRNGLAHCLSNQKQTLSEFEHALHILIHTFRRQYKNHPEVLATMNDIERVHKGKELQARSTLLDYI